MVYTYNEESINLLMRKNLFYVLMTLLFFVTAIPYSAAESSVLAQKSSGSNTTNQEAVANLTVEKAPTVKKGVKPLSQMIKSRQSSFTVPMSFDRLFSKPVTKDFVMKVEGTEGTIDLRGSLLSSTDTNASAGIYYLPTSSTGSYTLFNKNILPQWGAAYVDNRFYSVWQYNLMGILILNYVDIYDTESWTKLSSLSLPNNSLFSLSNTVDPTTN